MDPLLLTAAILMVVLAGVHSYLGERFILIPLFRREDLPKLLGDARFTKETLRLAWHVTSILGVGLAASLLALAAPGGSSPARHAHVIAATSAASGLVALVGSRGRHLSWVAFFAIAVLIWMAHP